MPIHVFFDNSNIYYGAQRAASELEPEVTRLAVRVYYRNLFRLIENGRPAPTRVLAGAVPPGNEALWDHAREAGYETSLLKKVERDDGNLVEQGVDELLHLRMAGALLDHERPQTLVLATGDGKKSDFGTSFVQQAERALRIGWEVEVWSWRAQLSGAFGRLGDLHPHALAVRELDPHYPSVTFIKGGTYEVKGQQIVVGDRIVSAP